PITQVRPASRLRNSTARNNAGRSAQNDRTVEQWSGPGFIVATRKIADRVSGAATGCGLITPSTPVLTAVIRDNSCGRIMRLAHVDPYCLAHQKMANKAVAEFFASLAVLQAMSQKVPLEGPSTALKMDMIPSSALERLPKKLRRLWASAYTVGTTCIQVC